MLPRGRGSVSRWAGIWRKEAMLAGTDPTAMSEDALIVAIAKHPIIVERPIVSNSKVALGRSYSIKAGQPRPPCLSAPIR
jgi:hypothetical protein